MRWWSLGIALLALGLSAFTYWSSRGKPAKLSLASDPPSYVTAFMPETLLLRIPVVIQNNGARRGVVGGIRFPAPAAWQSTENWSYAHWIAPNLNPVNGGETFFAPMSVAGGEVVVAVCEFNVAGVRMENVRVGSYLIDLQMPAFVDSAPTWSSLGTFRLRVTEHQRPGFGPEWSTHFKRISTRGTEPPYTAAGSSARSGGG